MTDPVPALATGLSAATAAFDRRSFLATLTAAGVLSGAALPADAADHPDAKLLELVADLCAAEAEWERFNDEGEAVWARYDALAPAVPTALLRQEDRDTFEICHAPRRLPTVEVDGADRHYYSDENDVPRLRWKVGVWRREGTGRNVVDRAEEILAALDAYVPLVEEAKVVSGRRAHEDEMSANGDLTDRLRREIAGLPALTAAGIAAKARAASTCWASDPTYLAEHALPKLLRNEGIFRNHPLRLQVTLAVSVVADAMKLGVAA